MDLLKQFFTIVVIRWPHEFWLRLNRTINLKIDRWRVRRVIKEAELKQSINGKRHFVLRDGNGYPIALTRKQIIHLKKAGIMSKNVTVANLYNECLYYSGQPKELKEIKTGELK